MQNKKEFFRKMISLSRGGLFFVLGILIAGIGYAVVTLTVGEKQDYQSDTDAGKLTSSEFNNLLDLARPFVNDEGNIGIGITPTAKLHVGGNVIATGDMISDSNVIVEENIEIGGDVFLPDDLCEEDYVMDGFNEDGSISCVEMPNLEASITSFTATPSSANYNNSVTLSWTNENVSTCTLRCTEGCSDDWNNIEDTVENTAETGVLIEPASFSLTCVGSVAGEATTNIEVVINPATVALTSDVASVVRGESVTLTWTPQSAITCQGTGGGAWAGAKDINGGSQVINNINNDTTYFIRCNGLDNQYSEEQITIIVKEEATVPEEVVVFNATAGDTQVTLNWDAPSDGGSPITGYRIERDSGDGAWWLLITTEKDVLEYVDIGLSNGSTYQYRIRAINTMGNSDWSEIVSVTPSAPENLGVILNYVVKQDVEANLQEANVNGQYPLYDLGWVELEWETTGNPTNCTATENDHNVWIGEKDVNGGSEIVSYRDAVIGHMAVLIHTITCSDDLGNQVSDSVSVQKNSGFTWWSTNYQNKHIPVFGIDDIELNSESNERCEEPRGISCQTTDKIDWRDAGQNYTCRADSRDTAGGYCYSIDNDNNCLDYQINILCPQQW